MLLKYALSIKRNKQHSRIPLSLSLLKVYLTKLYSNYEQEKMITEPLVLQLGFYLDRVFEKLERLSLRECGVLSLRVWRCAAIWLIHFGIRNRPSRRSVIESLLILNLEIIQNALVTVLSSKAGVGQITIDMSPLTKTSAVEHL